MSVTTTPPSIEARASSRAPVMVTPTSLAASTPILAALTRSISTSSASSVARMTALAAALLLLRPLAMGISLDVLTRPPYSRPRWSKTLSTQRSIKRVSTPGTSPLIPEEWSSSTTARVTSSMAKAEPFQVATAFIMEAAPFDHPYPFIFIISNPQACSISKIFLSFSRSKANCASPAREYLAIILSRYSSSAIDETKFGW